MSDDTTTDTNLDDQPQENGQAEGTIEVSAESRRSDLSENTQEPEAEKNSNAEENSEEVPANQDDLKEWARSKGINPEDPQAILKLARDTEKGFHKYSEKTKSQNNELINKVSDSGEFTENEAVIQEARLLNFYAKNPEAEQYDLAMGEVYANFAQSDPEFAAHLLRHPQTLLAMAKAENSNVQVQQARQEGKVEATQAIKKAQTASAPKANATSSAPTKTGWDEQRVQEVINSGQYDQYRNEIIAWERSQY